MGWPWGNEFIDDNLWEDLDSWTDDDVVVSSVNPVSKEKVSMVGTQFNTSNAVVAKLPVGSLLEVVDSGVVEVLDVPKPEFKPGDRIVTHHGPSTVVRKSDRIDIDGFDEEAELLYVADSEPVTVRRINRDEVDFV